MFENSLVCRIFTSISAWFENQFDNSDIIQGFLKKNDKIETSKGSLVFKIYVFIRALFMKIFMFLRFDKLFENSIFKISFLWCSAAVIFAPVLPTKFIIILALAGFGSLFLEFISDKEKQLKYFAINKYIIFYAFAYGISIITSVNPSGSLFGGLLTVMFVMFFFVVINSITTRKQLDTLVFFMVSIGVLVSLYGFYQYMFPSKYSGVWHDTTMFESISFRVYSTLDNPNVLGEYFLLIVPISFAYFIISKNYLAKLFYLGSTGVMMLCLILTLSRGCYIGIMVAMCMFLVMYDKRFIILAIIGLMMLPMLLPETIIERFMSIGNMEDSSTSYRVYIYMGTLAMLKDYWFSGIGPGETAFNMVYPSYAYNGISAPHSHNLFLQIITDTGVCGLIIFVSIIYQYYKQVFRTILIEKDKEYRTLAIGGCCAITGFFIQSLFDYSFYNYRVMILFWIVLGISLLFTDLSSMEAKR